MQYLATIFIALWLIVLRIIFKAMMTSGDSTKAEQNGKEVKPKQGKNSRKKANLLNASSGNSISVLCRRMAGSNWESSPEAKQQQTPGVGSGGGQLVGKKDKQQKTEKWTKYLAMDCEMVGIGEDGQDDMLARVSIVNDKGDVLLDKYVKAQAAVVDYRTKVSGIRPHDMENGEEFVAVQQEVRRMLQNKVLVGHSIKHDLAVLQMKHPHRFIRDTAKYRPLAKLVSNGATPSLKRLAKAILGMDIQTGEHSSVEDARACMMVYTRVSVEWERHLKKLEHRAHQGRHRS